MKSIVFILIIIGLFGCSSSPNYYKSGCRSADLICLGLMAGKVAIDSKPAKKCSDLTGAKKEQCQQNVKAIKQRIQKASNKSI